MTILLEQALASGSARAVQEAVETLTQLRWPDGVVDDDIAFDVLDVLCRPDVWDSELAGHILCFFKVGPTALSPAVKGTCATFLLEWGDFFSDPYASQVVTELLLGKSLHLGQSLD